MKGAFLRRFAKKQSETSTLVLTADDARTISTNFSCLEKAMIRIRRKANLGIRDITVLHLSSGDVSELRRLGYEVSKSNDGFKIKW